MYGTDLNTFQHAHPCNFIAVRNINNATFLSVTIDGVLDWRLDLLATLTYDLIIASSLISTLEHTV
jgi:hypothetical protein